MIRWLVALLFALAAFPAFAQPVGAAPVSPALRDGADALVSVLRDPKVDEARFAPAFLAQVPAAQVEAVAKQLRDTNGTVIGVARVTPESALQALVAVEYANAVVTVRIALEAPEPHRFIGLLVAGVERRGDSFETIIGEFRKLSGTSALLVAKLGEAAPVPFAAHNADASLATGSVFKLFVLAELARAVEAKERRWTDVVPLGPPSLPSGVTQNWPQGLPVTLATLATQMISISDNTATDTLITALGPAKVDTTRGRFGATAGSLPVLPTLDAFALKMPTNEPLRKRWINGSLSERRKVLDDLAPTATAIDASALAGGPLHIDTVEWPATMVEIAGVLDQLRRDPTALGILGVNPALSPSERARFDAVGFKGGSEAGVIALVWVLKARSGEWFVVAGAWNDPAKSVDNSAFSALVTRAVALVGK